MTSQTPEPAEPFSEHVSETGPTEEIPAAPGAAFVEPPASRAPDEVVRNASADRAAVRAFRPRRVVPAVITAVVMTAIGVLVALEVISALAGHPLRLLPYDRMFAWASSTPWSDRQVMAGAGLVGLLGLLLVLFALIPGRPTLIPVRTGDKDLVIGMQRRGFARSLAHAAERVRGVDQARVRLVGKTVRVDAHSAVRDTTGLADAVREAVTARIAALSPVWNHPVHVHLRGK
ncbi:DUF6286 domain-containing protein [Streptosporangium amethystogenes]|uniref:DUF6286 domain-containing protein n=1 Tax=Streptosporangium amethystogenes TaxID=2002 RepID=UPI0006896B40|nr:DUF6286 domain-containing protein [Streptosporangium amethystogenes]